MVYWIISYSGFQNNSSNKDGTNQKAEVATMTEAAKSKIHQVRVQRF